MNILLADIEYRYGESHEEFKNLEGGSVYAFVLEKDVRRAIEKIESAMTSMNLEAISFDSVFPY